MRIASPKACRSTDIRPPYATLAVPPGHATNITSMHCGALRKSCLLQQAHHQDLDVY
jgi:hypothetical protein